MFGLLGSASAVPIGFPDFTFDSQAGPSAGTVPKGVRFTGSTRLLTADAKVPQVNLGGTFTTLVGGEIDYEAHFLSASSGGGFVSAPFGPTTAANDLTLRDSVHGIDLTGKFISYTLFSAPPFAPADRHEGACWQEDSGHVPTVIGAR